MALETASELHRLTEKELLLVHNFRLCSVERQDVLLDFSGELAKSYPPPKKLPSNVFLLTGRRTK